MVRESERIDYATYTRLGEDGVEWLMADVERRAYDTAALFGITDPIVRFKGWDLHVVSHFTDYPMYLCGPNAPQITCAADVFNHVWHLDNPIAKYEVVVESKAVLDSYR